MQMLINKHGLPGIGVTGLPGKTGKSGNSIYFGTFDSFFSHIGGNTLNDVNIDYDDIDYDITYAEDEERLDIIYNTGDILYILSDNTSNAKVVCIIEVTDDMTTCTKLYLKTCIKHKKPFLWQYFNDASNLMFPINIIHKPEAISTNLDFLYNSNEKYKNGFINGTALGETNRTIKNVSIVTERYYINKENLYKNDELEGKRSIYNTYSEIPLKYNASTLRKDIVNNGDSYVAYYYQAFNGNIDTEIPRTMNTLLLLSLDSKTLSVDTLENTFVDISSNNLLYIDNLYIKNQNYGNVEAYNTLYDSRLNLDNDGNCYTLTELDYDLDLLSLIIDVSQFFKDEDFDMSEVHYGYIHKYWNASTYGSYYRPNHIKSYIIESSTFTEIEKDSDGNYIRNWDSSDYVNCTDIYIRKLLIDTLDTSRVLDVSKNLDKSVSKLVYEQYKKCKGIIKTHTVTKEIQKYYYQTVSKYYQKFHYFYENEIPKDKDIDASYYSGMFNVVDPSSNRINLAITDNHAHIYENHEILQWIELNDGLRYYSKQTKATYNKQNNTFDISANWVSPKQSTKPGFVDEKTIGNADMFTLTFDNSNKVNIDINKELDVSVTRYKIYENGIELHVSRNTAEITPVTVPIYSIPGLTALYNGSVKNIGPQHYLYTIKYSVDNENKSALSHIATYDRSIGGFTEYRKYPKITLHLYNDMESLELLNKSENGLLVNQFQTFMDIKIEDFNDLTWGKMSSWISEPILHIGLNNTLRLYKPNDSNKESGLLDTNYKVTYRLVNSSVDIFTATFNELIDNSSVLNMNNVNGFKKCETSFTLEDAMNGIYKVWILFETTNPEPLYCIGDFNITANDVSVGYKMPDNTPGTFTWSEESTKNTIVALSETLKFVVAPLSYTAAYNQLLPNITNKGAYKWYGSNNIVNLVLKPHGLDQIKYSNYTTERVVNWNALKFKVRYLQDNITTLSVNTLNINDIKDKIVPKLYNLETLASDSDDVYDSYLMFVYNSDILNSCKIDDELQFKYNDNSYLASEYGQLGNNTAVFTTQTAEVSIRTNELLNSMKIWNNEYENLYRYESDNPYKGNIETYGNGYQYLPNNADEGLYLTDNVMSLEEIKLVNSQYFFDDNNYFSKECSSASKYDDYTPNHLYRTLLYNLQWVYPKYYSENNTNLIKMLPLSEGTMLAGPNPGANVMPYNLCYSLYPRIMFNDEEQTNIVLMLRKPTVIDEGKEFSETDLCMSVTDYSTKQISSPLNVMN